VDPAARQLDLSPFNFIVCNSVLEYIASNLILPHEAVAIIMSRHLNFSMSTVLNLSSTDPCTPMRLKTWRLIEFPLTFLILITDPSELFFAFSSLLANGMLR
jgi:hypothetical protein